jgi:ABC-type phosphate transport system substrate-binding protein
MTAPILCFVFLASVGMAAESRDPVVVVNSGNPISKLTRAQVKKLLTGVQPKWPSGEKVVVLTTPPGSVERVGALRVFCEMTEQLFNVEMIRASFVGEERPQPRHAPNGKAIVQAVQATPGAIGFVAEADVTDQVKIVRVE